MKIGIVTGAFDLLHAGHIHLFKEAKKYCDHLIVALHVDPSIQRDTKNKPVESVLERQIKLDGCEEVGHTVVYEKEEDLPIIFKYYDINIRFLGSDYLPENGTQKPISYEDLLPIKYLDSLPMHTSEIREKWVVVGSGMISEKKKL